MRPILCVIDLTESSATVLKIAVRIACAFKTSLTVLFPYRLIDNSFTGDLSKLNAKLVEDSKTKFNKLKQQEIMIDLLSYEFQPEIGFTYDRIKFYLKSNEPEMIIIGQHQAHTMNEVNNTTLQTLIVNSKLPFTLVPECKSPLTL